MFQGIDHHWRDNVYATCGDQVDIWSEDRSEPVRTFKWGVDTVHSVKFNPVEVKSFKYFYKISLVMINQVM